MQIIHINGAINFEMVPALSKTNRGLIDKNPELIFDLSQVTSCDNTGVGLLVGLASYAKSKGKKICFRNLSEQIFRLLEAAKVREMLPIN